MTVGSAANRVEKGAENTSLGSTGVQDGSGGDVVSVAGKVQFFEWPGVGEEQIRNGRFVGLSLAPLYFPLF